jgi:hypothetical protein
MSDEPNQLGSNGQAAPADWRPFLTDELKADPVVSDWASKTNEKDVPSIVKSYAHLTKKLGNAINLPGKEARPEEITALKAKLVEAGVMPKPIADPKEYAIAKPDNLPPGVNWSDELSTKLATTLHKHQIPKEAVADLMALHAEALGGLTGSFAQDRDKVIAELQSEHKEKYDERKALAERLIPEIFKTEEEAALANQLGLGENARFISILMRLAPFAQQDSSFMEKLGEKNGTVLASKAQDELKTIQTDPKHPMYAAYKSNDPKAMEYIKGLYREAYPGTVELV